MSQMLLKANRKLYSSSKRILFKIPPETIHNRTIKLGKYLGSKKLLKSIINKLFNYKHPSLEQTLLGIKFKNPIGLSAGFDKNAELLNILSDIGFGFAEVGSITYKPCKGNSGIRLKRLPKKESIYVNLGLNNLGSKKISSQLKNKKFSIPYGISIAKTNCKETAQDDIGIQDYISSLKTLSSLSSYITINISCPNAFGGQPFSRPKAFSKLMKEISKLKIKKPIFIKLSPDLTKRNINQILRISKKHNIAGFICSNLTKNKNTKTGGFSGKQVEKKANSLLSYIYKKTRSKKYVLIGVGGVSSAEDAYKKIKLGANLIQLITGMIYHGPQLISEINHDLVMLLKKDGYKNISEAVGKE